MSRPAGVTIDHMPAETLRTPSWATAAHPPRPSRLGGGVVDPEAVEVAHRVQTQALLKLELELVGPHGGVPELRYLDPSASANEHHARALTVEDSPVRCRPHGRLWASRQARHESRRAIDQVLGVNRARRDCGDITGRTRTSAWIINATDRQVRVDAAWLWGERSGSRPGEPA